MSGATFEQELEYISGLTSAGIVAAVSNWTWLENQPPTFNSTVSQAHKFGGDTAGTAGTITYFFDDPPGPGGSNWTTDEQAAWRASMDLWSAVANVTFTLAGNPADATVVIVRDPNEHAGYSTVSGISTIGSSVIDTSAKGQIVVAGLADLNLGAPLTATGGYAYYVAVHELGHVLGLGHSGSYNGTVLPGTQQYGAYDNNAYSIMSYIAPDEPKAKYFSEYTVNFDWGTSADGFSNNALTPMMLDILAAQRLYGAPAHSVLDGGDTFGFHTTITGDIARFFDFTVNTVPIVTLFDTGAGNTLDLSGFSENATVNLNPGTFSSAHGLTNNIAIAFGTIIETAIGGSGNDTLVGGTANNHLTGGSGFDTLVGGLGNDDLDGGANPELGQPGAQGDVMLGGDGNDTYHVDSGLDFVDEGIYFPDFGFGGTDTIISTADFYWDIASVGEIDIVSESVVDVNNDGVTIVGGVFDNTLIGHKGTDVLFGRGGSDTYRAGDGVDFISLSTLGVQDTANYTADGHNTIIVDPRTSGPFSYDIVFEFDPAKDKIDVSHYTGAQDYTSAAQVLSHAVDDGAGNCYIVLGDGLDYLYLVGLEKADLLAGDFIV